MRGFIVQSLSVIKFEEYVDYVRSASKAQGKYCMICFESYSEKQLVEFVCEEKENESCTKLM